MGIDRLHQLPDPEPPEPPAPDVAAALADVPSTADAKPVVLALELGWRLAVLYADLEQPLHAVGRVKEVPVCLPAVETMSNGDQLEVQVRAAASLAFRLKATDHAHEILALAADVHDTCRSRRETVAVRRRLRECHGKLVKELWFKHEAQGKAYELGTSLFDSWNRVRMIPADEEQRTIKEWRAVFGRDRVERIKVLLDDLQTQLSPTAVTVVKAHLDFWHTAVDKHVGEQAGPPPRDGIELLGAQTYIWRQLLTEAKQPEAFLKREERRELHRTFKLLVWRSFLRPLPILTALAAIAIVVALLAGVRHAASTAQGAIALLGAIGLSQASLTVIARDRIRDWTELLWNRALADVVFEATLLADDVFEFKHAGLSSSLADTCRRVARRPVSPLPLRPTAQL
jgi:hypothetical protein